jgi:phosphonate transport system ATP-binding protein
MIHLRNVTLTRGDTAVLQDICADIPQQRITAIVGRSGVGKTTLLGALNGLIRPVHGEIRVAGLGCLGRQAILQEHRRHTATVFQDHALIERLTAIDNVLLGLADRRHPLSLLPWPRAMRHQAAQALDEVGLLHRANARVAHLSGGERQRVGVARALVRQPQLLLGDEPFASVDPSLVRLMAETMRGLVMGSGMTVVLVMHQIETALALADKVIGLVAGQIAYDGPAAAFDARAQARVFPEMAA